MTEDEEREREDRIQWPLSALAIAFGAAVAVKMAECARRACEDGGDPVAEEAVLAAWLVGTVDAFSRSARETAAEAMRDMADLDDSFWARGAVREAMTRSVATPDPDGVIWEQVPAERAALRAGVARLNDSLDFYADSMRLRHVDGSETDIRTWWREALTESTLDVQQGEHFMRESMRNMAGRLNAMGGVRVIRNGRSYEIEGFCRQRLRDEWAMVRDEQTAALGRELGMDCIEISAHSQCAADHLPYQGRVYRRDEWERIEGGLERPIGMYNCRHVKRPCYEGDAPANDGEQLERMRRDSTRKVRKPNGEECTAYEFTQWQRGRERKVREERRDARIAKALGLQDEANAHTRLAGKVLREYEAASEAARIRTRPEALRLGTLIGTTRPGA